MKKDIMRKVPEEIEEERNNKEHPETVSIPNKEVAQEYVNAIRTLSWPEVIRSVEASNRL